MNILIVRTTIFVFKALVTKIQENETLDHKKWSKSFPTYSPLLNRQVCVTFKVCYNLYLWVFKKDWFAIKLHCTNACKEVNSYDLHVPVIAVSYLVDKMGCLRELVSSTAVSSTPVPPVVLLYSQACGLLCCISRLVGDLYLDAPSCYILNFWSYM